MEYSAQYMLRCHSKTDRDTTDVSTQVWQAAFGPSKKTHLVATCGGNKLCIINAETGIVQYRYSWPKGLLYTLSWSTSFADNNILATAGTNNTIVFIDLLTNTAYLHYNLYQKPMRKVFISSILFHPYQEKLFCAQSDGHLYVFEFKTKNKRIVNVEQQHVVDLECEIFGLTFCETNDCLLIATNTGLRGWNNSQRQDQELIIFELPENPNDLYKQQNEKVIDSVEVVKDNWIATKVALHGVIYVFNLDRALHKIKNNKCIVKPAFILKWSDTDNYFMSCGVGLDGNVLACGDDKGSVWIYDLENIGFQSAECDAKIVEAHTVLKWPKLYDSNLKKKKKLDVDVYDIVMAKCAVHSSGKCIVAVTNNNFVCIYIRR